MSRKTLNICNKYHEPVVTVYNNATSGIAHSVNVELILLRIINHTF